VQGCFALHTGYVSALCYFHIEGEKATERWRLLFREAAESDSGSLILLYL